MSTHSSNWTLLCAKHWASGWLHETKVCFKWENMLIRYEERAHSDGCLGEGRTGENESPGEWVALEGRERAYVQTPNQRVTKMFSTLCMYSAPALSLTPFPILFFLVGGGVNIWLLPMCLALTYVFSFKLRNALRSGSHYLLNNLPEVSQLLTSRASPLTPIFWSKSYILNGSQNQNFSSAEDVTCLKTNTVQMWGTVILVMENQVKNQVLSPSVMSSRQEGRCPLCLDPRTGLYRP